MTYTRTAAGPSVGRTVHYIDKEHGGRCDAAIITRVRDTGQVALHVMPPDGPCYSIPIDEGPHPDHTGNRFMHSWHWSEMV